MCPITCNLPSTASLSEHYPEGYPVIQIKNKWGEGKVALHGAHLMDWTPTGEKPIIYTSPTAIYKEGKAIRGGVPICWPWFNAHPTDTSLPSHGIGRNRFWELDSVVDEQSGTLLRFTLRDSAETQAIWNHSFLTTVEILLGEQIKISLRTQNTGEKTMQVGGALHTYLSLSDIAQVSVHGVEGADYIDTVGEEMERTQEAPLKIDREVDRIFTNHVAEITLRDQGWQRELHITRTGSRSAVIWNPWIEKAAQLGDLPDEAYQHFLCIEAANARADVYDLLPGEEHTLSTTLTHRPY